MNIKPHLHSIGIAACICLAVSIIVASILIIELNKRVQSLQGANRSLTSEMITYRNDNGRLLSQVSAAEIRAKDIERQLPEVYASLKKDFDIKSRNLRAYMQAEFVARGSGNAEIKPITELDSGTYSNGSGEKPTWHTLKSDTTELQPFAMFIDDGYLNLMSEVYSEDRAPYQYTYSDTLKYAFHMKGKLFSKKQLYGTGMLSNANARILNSEAVLINEFRDRRFGIGPSVSYGLGPDGMNWQIGISIHYSIIKF